MIIIHIGTVPLESKKSVWVTEIGEHNENYGVHLDNDDPLLASLIAITNAIIAQGKAKDAYRQATSKARNERREKNHGA